MMIPAGEARCELVVRRSRFMGYAGPVRDANQAREIVERERAAHPDSDHVTHAFLAGPHGELSGMSDDREPHGTAGRPMLEVLRGSGITNIVAVVTRYFGGTKLGTGGLARSYADTVLELLAKLPKRELVERRGFSLTLPYELFDRANRLLAGCGGECSRAEFGERVVLTGAIPAASCASFAAQIAELTAGRVAPLFSDPA